MYGVGIRGKAPCSMRVERKTVRSPARLSFGDERLGQGPAQRTAFLREHPDVTQQSPRCAPGADRARPRFLARLLPTAAPEDAAKAHEEVAATAESLRTSRSGLSGPRRSRAELDARLASRGFGDGERQNALDKLERLGLPRRRADGGTESRAVCRPWLRRRVHPRRPRTARVIRRRALAGIPPEPERRARFAEQSPSVARAARLALEG